jgi:hypothetical protein
VIPLGMCWCVVLRLCLSAWVRVRLEGFAVDVKDISQSLRQ